MSRTVRFCKQRDKYSCGPIALLNIDKFYGERVTYADLKYYRKLVDCKPLQGTKTSAMSDVLGRASRRTWVKTKEFLQDGWSCLIIQTGDGRANRLGHYSLVVTDKGGRYILVNHYRGQEYAGVEISWREFYGLWRKAYRLWYVKRLC